MGPTVHVFQLYRTAGLDAVWWRCISPNGRSLATCPAPLGSVADARAAIAALVERATTAEVLVRPTLAHRWRWSIQSGPEVLALGSSDHDRRIRCANAANQFVTQLPVASIDSVVHVFRRRDVTGARPVVAR